MRFFVNPLKAAVSLAAAAVFLFLVFVSYQNRGIVPLILYSVLSVIYLVLTCYYSAFFEMDETGVRNRFLFWTYNVLTWNQVKEVGIANMRVIKNAEKKKVGELYFYFSKEVMTEKDRFAMCLHWPPKGKPYLRYSVKRLKAVQNYWKEKPAYAWLSEEAYLNRYFKQ